GLWHMVPAAASTGGTLIPGLIQALRNDESPRFAGLS
ncbi:MAG: hypothetical protein QOJ21_1804, partial [Solirubrobacteraceae bacterium]|nr:hypothetical protein [Solirubrobacteraceae bacterium]